MIKGDYPFNKMPEDTGPEDVTTEQYLYDSFVEVDLTKDFRLGGQVIAVGDHGLVVESRVAPDKVVSGGVVSVRIFIPWALLTGALIFNNGAESLEFAKNCPAYRSNSSLSNDK